MLKLQDFVHLAQLDDLIAQMVDAPSGLILVVGLDPRPTQGVQDGLLPGGRGIILRILLSELLARFSTLVATVVATDRSALRVSPQFAARVKWALVSGSFTYGGRIASLSKPRPDLLVIDRLPDDAALFAALEAARSGLPVLASLETIYRGADVLRLLVDRGATDVQLSGVHWVVTVGRLPALCADCKKPVEQTPIQVMALLGQYPWLGESPTFYRSAGCARCGGSGRRGDVAVFDVFRTDHAAPNLLDQLSVLPMPVYALGLAAQGILSLGDALHFETNLLRRTYTTLTVSEGALAAANAALQRQVLELEASNRVLEHQTRALISLQDIGQALIASTDLADLAERVCRRACDLCRADRAILYLHRPDQQAEILAVSGWDAGLIGRQVRIKDVLGVENPHVELSPYHAPPPGTVESSSSSAPKATGQRRERHTALRVSLMAQDELVGAMIISRHSRAALERGEFLPGEVALLKTFANQAALAIQRAGLFESLRAKIAQLEAAQAELAQKARMEHELALARQVQQSVLPRVFPQVPGYLFAARNEPARQVGGDFYDVFWIDDDHFGLVVADVSDKGMPAALYMGLTRSLILAEARRERSPRAVLGNVNRLLLELGDSRMFVTLFYGLVDIHACKMIYARAGHDRPLLLRDDQVIPLGGEGTFLGFWETEALGLGEEEITLYPGDCLVLYTDGLTDVLAADDRLFGLERLKQLVQSCLPCSPTALCEHVFAHLTAYRGDAEQFDDMTILVIQVEQGDRLSN